MSKPGPRHTERRRYPRYPIRWPVAFEGDLLEGHGEVANISLLGCAIDCKTVLNEGRYLSMSMELPHEDMRLKIELAVVRWVSGNRSGIEFIKIAPKHQQRLQDVIRFLEMVPKS